MASANVEEVQPLAWAWRLKSEEMRSALDAKIQHAFESMGYKTRPGEEYGYVTGISRNPKADMSLAFVKPDCAQALCYRCSSERRGLHIHVFPRTDEEAMDDLATITKKVSKSINRVTWLDYSVATLTWNYKLVPFAALVSVISYLMSEASKAQAPIAISWVLPTMAGLGFIVLMGYLLLVMPLVLARVLYAYRFNMEV